MFSGSALRKLVVPSSVAVIGPYCCSLCQRLEAVEFEARGRHTDPGRGILWKWIGGDRRARIGGSHRGGLLQGVLLA
jgi:hypothetical protein